MRRGPEQIILTKEEKAKPIEAIKAYLEENLDTEISIFQTELFLDFLTESIGSIYYNRGIADALKYMEEKTEDMYQLLR